MPFTGDCQQTPFKTINSAVLSALFNVFGRFFSGHYPDKIMSVLQSLIRLLFLSSNYHNRQIENHNWRPKGLLTGFENFWVKYPDSSTWGDVLWLPFSPAASISKHERYPPCSSLLQLWPESIIADTAHEQSDKELFIIIIKKPWSICYKELISINLF